MPVGRIPRSWPVAAAVLVGCWVVRAQEPPAEDLTIDTIRTLAQISVSDQRRIGDWVQVQVDKLTAAPKESRPAAAQSFRKTLIAQFENPQNSPAFKAQLAAQTAQLAAAQFAEPTLERWSGFALARVLGELNSLDASPGLLAGLKAPLDVVRYLCADALSGLKPAIAADKAALDPTIAALRAAALTERSPIVLSRIYAALGHTHQVPAVLDAYLAVFEKRLAARRGGALMVDGAEIEAFEFFRTPAVLQALNPDQRTQLAKALAVFLRLDAERYNMPGLKYDEIDRIERLLDADESNLAELAGAGKGGKIRDELAAAAHDNRANVLAEALKWVGNAQSNEPGALNAAPFNVPLGAP